ncbi:MAG: SGNH/GDSL hydrolase family protein [Kiritimatiellaeota bacterium]|nr:SGNH/GDSL hydrolase family protein [Kiritimatiellota bacterium]
MIAAATEKTVDAVPPYPLRDAVECRARRGLPNFFGKLEAGGTVRIAYLGGSITAQPGWRVLSRQWFQKQYPKARIEEINAAIGGTGSDLGVFRLQHDVLRFKPDLLFVEFAVNDGGAPPDRIQKAMEGIVRQTWKADPTTDICYVYTSTQGMLRDLQAGKFPRAASAMEGVADHYGIPSIHMGLEVARLEKTGKVLFKAPKPKTAEEKATVAGKVLFSKDGVHPYTDTGHPLYLAAIVRSMAKIKRLGTAGPHSLPAPLQEDNWADARMVPLSRAMLSPGWQKLDPTANRLAKRFGKRLPGLWKASKPGETLRFRFRGKAVAVYDIVGPDCGRIIVRLDDRAPVVRPRFDAYCTYHRLSKLQIAAGLPDKVHSVVCKIDSKQPDKAAILAKRHQKIDDPKRFDDTAWYAGALLLRGELVE